MNKKLNALDYYTEDVIPEEYDLANNIVPMKTIECAMLMSGIETLGLFRKSQKGCLVDLGCGTGILAKMVFEGLGEFFEEYILVDGSPKMLEFCQKTICKKNSKFVIKQANLEHGVPAVDTGVASLVVSNAVTIYLSKLDAFIKESGRMLKQGGVLAFDAITHQGKNLRSIQLESDDVYIYSHSLEKTTKLLQLHGFACLAIAKPKMPGIREGSVNIYAIKI